MDVPRPTDALRSMDAVQIERLFWAVVFAALVAVAVPLVLAPDPTGALSIGLAVATFVIALVIAARVSRGSLPARTKPGDQTVRYVVFFVVALAGRIGFGALGFEGFVVNLVTFGAAWVLAARAEWLNPVRWNGGVTP